MTDWVIEGEYLMAIFRDGSIGWEGAQEKMREVPRGAAPLNPIQFEQ